MSKFKSKKTKSRPQISTASLPDIVFMLLFFFMVVTVIRQREIMVDITLPQATEIMKIKDARKAAYIYIGTSRMPQSATKVAVQMNDKFVAVENMATLIKHSSKEDATISLKIDKDVPMGIVTDVKTEIRKAERLKICYLAEQEY